MGKTNAALGKSVENHLGYNVRMMVTGKADEKTKKTVKIHNGKFGIYAGKKLIQEITKQSEAKERIEKIVSDKSIARKK
jgi:hypothetical protein